MYLNDMLVHIVLLVFDAINWKLHFDNNSFIMHTFLVVQSVFSLADCLFLFWEHGLIPVLLCWEPGFISVLLLVWRLASGEELIGERGATLEDDRVFEGSWCKFSRLPNK